jgi:hypothetical protein
MLFMGLPGDSLLPRFVVAQPWRLRLSSCWAAPHKNVQNQSTENRHMKKLIVPSLIGITSILLITGCKTDPGQSGVPKTGVWTSSQVAAADSVEGWLRSHDKRWVRTPGEIKVGSYVQDMLEGRLNQPEGRGAIGKVVYVARGDNGQLDAMVDFGRGYRVGIHESELSLVSVE